MSYLLDTNICSAHIRRPAGLAHRFVQYSGRLYVSTIVLGELYAGAYMSASSTKILAGIADLLSDTNLLLLVTPQLRQNAVVLQRGGVAAGIGERNALRWLCRGLIAEIFQVTNHLFGGEYARETNYPPHQIANWPLIGSDDSRIVLSCGQPLSSVKNEISLMCDPGRRDSGAGPLPQS